MPGLDIANSDPNQFIHSPERTVTTDNDQKTGLKIFNKALCQVANSTTPLLKTLTITSSAIVLASLIRYLNAPDNAEKAIALINTDMDIDEARQCRKYTPSTPVHDDSTPKMPYPLPTINLDSVCRAYTDKKISEHFELLTSLFRSDFRNMREAYFYSASICIIIGIICGMFLSRLCRSR